jgi:hypothetical protein
VIRECTGLRFVTWRAYIVCKKVINKHTRVLSRVVPTGVYYQQQVKCITCDEYHSRVNTSVYLKIPKLKTPLLCKMQHSSIYHSSCSVQICTTHPPPFLSQPPSKQTWPEPPQRQHPYPHQCHSPHQAYRSGQSTDSASASSPLPTL